MQNEMLLVSIYYTYGKGVGEELDDRYLIDNTKEGREEVLDEINYDSSIDNEEDFINGERDSFQFDKYGGDWDEPTGGFITVTTLDEELESIERKASREASEIKKLFGMEESK